MTDQLIPVYPEPASGYKLFAVTWLSLNGEMYCRLIGALNGEEAARRIAQGVDHTIRHTDQASIDVRECGPVDTFKTRVVL